MSIKQICRCGHDIDTHYRDPSSGVRWACCGLYCNCKMYLDARTQETPKVPKPASVLDELSDYPQSLLDDLINRMRNSFLP